MYEINALLKCYVRLEMLCFILMFSEFSVFRDLQTLNIRRKIQKCKHDNFGDNQCISYITKSNT